MLKKIKEKKKITLKGSIRITWKFFKIIAFQYTIFIIYLASFLLPLIFLDAEFFERMNIFLIMFIALFPAIQSLFHIHYTETGSSFSRFEVWIGSVLFFLVIPIILLFAI
ncbi:MAG: hypothetical protein ACRC1F_01995 [Metamycoplasmataceae bacterium]